MRVKRLFLLIFSFYLILWAVAGYSVSCSAEIQSIDAQIEQLEGMKRGFEAKALRHNDMAEYMQFDQQLVLETRRHLQIADENRAKAAMVQEEIDRLKAKRDKLKK
jgi:hypothetical protein